MESSIRITPKRVELTKSQDVKTFFSKLTENYGGKWVAITGTGELIANDKIEGIYSEVEQKSAKISGVFYVAKKRELQLR